MSWMGYAGAVAGCIVVSEVGKVQINNYFQAHLPHTTYKELIAAGVVALYNLIKSSKEAPSASSSSTGEVPWPVIIALGVFKVQWSVWRDLAINLAPNAGLAKNV